MQKGRDEKSQKHCGKARKEEALLWLEQNLTKRRSCCIRKKDEEVNDGSL